MLSNDLQTAIEINLQVISFHIPYGVQKAKNQHIFVFDLHARQRKSRSKFGNINYDV